MSATDREHWDLVRVEWGEISEDQMGESRSPKPAWARVRPSSACPRGLIEQFGLHAGRTMKERTKAGLVSVRIYQSVRHQRARDETARTTVKESAMMNPPVIGQTVLTMLDWVIDPGQKKLIGNPDHGGEWMFDMFHHEFCV